jgi:endonuclease YncB( thermonuclease family)
MKLLLGVLAAMGAALPLLAAEMPQQVSGPALAVDGDGFKIGESEVRLFGIDAPEMPRRQCWPPVTHRAGEARGQQAREL